MSDVSDASPLRQWQTRFTAYLRDPSREPVPIGVDERRMAVYRDLVFNNVETFLSTNFPVIRSLYDETDWKILARDFLREHVCRTPLFPQFGREFLDYLEFRRDQRRDDPDFLFELAHYEWAELALSLDVTDIAQIPHDPAGDPLTGIPVMSPLACVVAYRYPVHRIGCDFRPTAPGAEPTVLLLVRGRDDRVRFNEINMLTARLIEQLQDNRNRSGTQCLDDLLDAQGISIQTLRTEGAQVVRELVTHEAILGTRPAV